MLDPRLDLLMALEDHARVRLGGVDARGVFAQGAVEDERVSSTNPRLSMVGYPVGRTGARVLAQDETEIAVEVGETQVEEVERHGRVLGPYVVEQIEATESAFVRFRLREL